MVGSARTDLIKATVEQSNKWSIYQSESTKFRIMESDVEMLRALTPSKTELKHFEDRSWLRSSAPAASPTTRTPPRSRRRSTIATTELADVLTPDQEDEDRLSDDRRHLQATTWQKRSEDAEAYDDVIEAHHESAEWFERAQLCAEIGIVIASIALLMASRGVWAVSLLIGLSGALIIGYTFLHTRSSARPRRRPRSRRRRRTAPSSRLEKDDDDGDETTSGAQETKPTSTMASPRKRLTQNRLRYRLTSTPAAEH